MIFMLFVRRQVELGHVSCRLSCGHIPMDIISRSTNYIDQLDKPQSVSLHNLALLPRGIGELMWRVIKEHRRKHVAKGRKNVKIYVN